MATVTRYLCLHISSVLLSRYVCSYTLFFSKNVVFPAQAEYSYFLADFRLKIILYYSLNIIAYDISVLEFIDVSITSVWYLDLYRVTLCMSSTAFRSEAKMSRQTTLGRFDFEKRISHRTSVVETKVTDFV